jgi:hypothetical protein
MAHELTKSALGFSWAMSLFGARQTARLIASMALGRAARPGLPGAPELYAVTQSAQDQFNDLVWAAFQAGDELQRNAVDLLFDVVTLRAFAPDYVKRLTTGLVEQSRETGRVLTPGAGSRLAWQELKNKYEVYNLVKRVRELLEIPAGVEFPLGDLIEKAYALGAYPDLWAVEGLGHDYALAFWKPPDSIRELLTGARAGAIPDKSLTMMHAGIGLAFAEKLLMTITPYSPNGKIRRVLGEFIRLCNENSREGYAGAAYESLGLVARTWHAQMMSVIDRALQETAPEVVGYFWHGAGRALYFLPFHFVPGSPSAWLAAAAEAPHETARLNLATGLAWATTLVNMRQPEILAGLVKSRSDVFARDGAFTNGVMSSLIMGYDITPGDVYIREFCRYQPDQSDASFAEKWRELVTRPCAAALERYYPALKQSRRLGEVFHYQSWEDYE